MTDNERAMQEIGRAADELVPALSERLTRHGLGEIEMARGQLRLRVVGSAPVASADAPSGGSGAAAPTGPGAAGDASPAPGAPAAPATVGVPSPAVGFFVYADGLGPGLDVTKGDAIGYVEMLGVRHDVRAPRGGTVRHLVSESGEAVEYGQVVVELEPAGDAR